jgi:hypothetical protein
MNTEGARIMNMQMLTMQDIFLPFGPKPLEAGVALHGFAHDFRFNFGLFSAMRQALQSHRASMSVTVMGRADFIHHVTLHLPEVSCLIEEDDFGILHLEMGAMKLATREAILSYEFHTVRRHFSFISYLFEHADQDLNDAIRVSYLENMFIGEETPEYEHARSMLPKNLAEALKKLDLRNALFELQPSRLDRLGQNSESRFQLTFP